MVWDLIRLFSHKDFRKLYPMRFYYFVVRILRCEWSAGTILLSGFSVWHDYAVRNLCLLWLCCLSELLSFQDYLHHILLTIFFLEVVIYVEQINSYVLNKPQLNCTYMLTQLSYCKNFREGGPWRGQKV